MGGGWWVVWAIGCGGCGRKQFFVCQMELIYLELGLKSAIMADNRRRLGVGGGRVMGQQK